LSEQIGTAEPAQEALNPEIERIRDGHGSRNHEWRLGCPCHSARHAARARSAKNSINALFVGEHGLWKLPMNWEWHDSDLYNPTAELPPDVDVAVRDPVSGTQSHRSNLCDVQLVR